MTRQFVLDPARVLRDEPDKNYLLQQVMREYVVEGDAQQRCLALARERLFLSGRQKNQTRMQSTAGVVPTEIGHVVGDDDETVLDRVMGDGIVGRGAQIDVIDVAGGEPPAPCELHEVGGEILIDQQRELMWLDARPSRA